MGKIKSQISKISGSNEDISSVVLMRSGSGFISINFEFVVATFFRILNTLISVSHISGNLEIEISTSSKR